MRSGHDSNQRTGSRIDNPGQQTTRASGARRACPIQVCEITVCGARAFAARVRALSRTARTRSLVACRFTATACARSRTASGTCRSRRNTRRSCLRVASFSSAVAIVFEASQDGSKFIDDDRSAAFERPGLMLEPQQFDELGLGRPVHIEAVEVCLQCCSAHCQFAPRLGAFQAAQRRTLQLRAGGNLGDGFGDVERCRCGHGRG